MRVLIVYVDLHLAYAQALEGVVKGAKPGADVRIVLRRGLLRAVSSFRPHLFVSGEATDALPDVRAGFSLSPEPYEPSDFRLGRRH